MKMYFLVIFAIGLMLVSCKQEDPLIDNTTNSWKMLVVQGENKNIISQIEQPNGTTLRENILPNIEIKSQISKLVAYGASIYVLVPGDFKIHIFNRWDYSFEATIDFSEDQLEPTAIAFANASDAYVAHKNSDKVSLVDIKFNKIAKTITVGNSPSGIAYSQNLIVVTNYNSNSISLIDTRSYSKISDQFTREKPTYVSTSNASGLIAVLCTGNGKNEDSANPKTSGYVQIFNPITKTFINEAEVKTSIVAGADIAPNGLVVSDKDIAFITTDYGLFSINVKNPNQLNVVKKEEYKSLCYNFPQQEIILFRANNTAFAAAQTSGKILYDLVMPPSYGAVMAY